MKVLLIAPASGKWFQVGRSRLFGGRVFRFSLLSLLTVAAETPDGVEVRVVDEQVQDVPIDEVFDLVGISCMTAAAPRAYQLADLFRRRGTPVVLGGTHPTLMPEEALEHADAVCVGDAEGVWRRVVEDARRGELAGLYRAEPTALQELRRPPRDLLAGRYYGTVQAVQATRGCPNRCSFCTVSACHDGVQRRRPADEVAAEVAALPRRFVIFVDDNLTADRAYARELFSALRPLGKLWVTQSTLEIADDPELVRLAAKAGCIGLFVGLETFSDASLRGVNKGFHRVAEYRRRIRLLHRHGIGVEAGIVFGFEHDDPGVFRRTLALLEDLRIDMVQISVLTPLPGTPFHQRMRHRLVDRDYEHYDFHHVVFQPRGMSVTDLQAGHDWMTAQFYRPWRIARRLARLALRPRAWRILPFAAAINLGYYGRTVRFGLRGHDPAAQEGSRLGDSLGSSGGPSPRPTRGMLPWPSEGTSQAGRAG
jgi:radical SAM superfamily enzyme YgiQ (UPF0313 family)